MKSQCRRGRGNCGPRFAEEAAKALPLLAAFPSLLASIDSTEMRARGRLALIDRLNREPLNLVAERWLDSDWRSERSLHILTLMQLALYEDDRRGR